MKKLLVFLLTLAICVSLFGCAETGIEDTQNSNTERQSVNVTETTKVTESTETTKATESAETTETTEITEVTEVTNATESVQHSPDDVQVTMVWIPTKGGTKYHSNQSCSGMDNPDQVTKSQAEQQGFTPCKKCYKLNAAIPFIKNDTQR